MRSKTLLLPFCLFAITSQAQDSSFQLKDYKYRTPGFKALSVNVSFSANATDSKADTLTQSKGRNLSLFPSHFSYSRIISTEKRVHNSFIDFTPSLYSYFAEANGNPTKSTNLRYSFIWDRNDRFYKRNNWFFEIGNRLRHELSKTWGKDTLYINNNGMLRLENTVTLGFGKGRIERVQDAQMALYILNDLQQQGLLNATVSPEVAQNFAELITDINNKRVFDSRKKRIYELTRIESFLKSSGLINQIDIRHFTTINDNWTLANNPWRFSGRNWYFRARPGVGLINNTYKLEQSSAATASHYNQKFVTVSPVWGYENYKPLNLKWQRDMRLDVSYYKTWNRADSKTVFNGTEDKNATKTKEWQAGLFASYGIGYYPNTRTGINGSLSVEAVYFKPVAYDIYKNTKMVKPALNISADYFLSYRTSLSAQLNLLYEHRYVSLVNGKKFENHFFNSGFSFGLSHIIF